ncbi:MAG: hypothetical protein Q8M92_03010, partial [Candidatus Subteraquimicrobiales bacterium]|nr:hypothetical protein [Candidatus Subteraquimicrobiales bacterium]
WYGIGWGTNTTVNNIEYSKRLTASTDWATNREGVTDSASAQLSPAIALDSANNVYVVWAGKGWGPNTANNNIQSRKRTTSWQTQAAITDLAAEQTNPALLWHLQPTIFTNVKTNIITSGHSFVWTTGAGVKFYASDAIIWPKVYFVLTPSSSTPTVGTSPTVTVTATKKDATNADVTVTGYNVATTVSVNATGAATFSAPSAGNPISLSNIDFTNGVTTPPLTITDNTAQSVTVTATDQNNTSITGNTAVSFQAAAANKLILNAPADIDAGTRAAYTVTLADAYNNNVNAGVGGQVVYLFSSSASANKQFYDAASGGNVITSVTIAQGSSMANAWYYDDTAGTYTITASDATPADGATGLADATDSITV